MLAYAISTEVWYTGLYDFIGNTEKNQFWGLLNVYYKEDLT